jgi:transcriptional regulator with XRE-family HTH domain
MYETIITEPFLLKLQEIIDTNPDTNVSRLAVDAGMSNSAIRLMLAQNKSPTIKTARKICAALGTTLEEFMSQAKSAEEREIVELASRLPAALRQKLLGYGQGLLEQSGLPSAKSGEEH